MRCVVQRVNRPAWMFPLPHTNGGWFQVMLRARGDMAVGVLPSLKLYNLDDGGELATARVPSETWRRFPLGAPVWLKPGHEQMAVEFANDFGAANSQDRNLYLDQFEVLEMPRAQARDAGPVSAAACLASETQAGHRCGIAFREVWLDSRVTGPVRIRAEVWKGAGKGKEAPVVELLLNGTPIPVKSGDSTEIVVTPNQLKPGRNTVQWRIQTHDGSTELSTEQFLERPKSASPPKAVEPLTVVFGMTNGAWDGKPGRFPAVGAVAATGVVHESYMEAARRVLKLPDAWVGRVQPTIWARGDQFRGAPELEVSLVSGGGRKVLGRVRVPAGWSHVPLPAMDVVPGPKSLEFAFVNDDFAKGQGDRNVHVASVSCRVALDPDRAAPVVRLRYPTAGQVLRGADALVVELFEDRQWGEAWVLLDGKDTGIRLSPPERPGLLVIPLPLRGVAEGRHELRLAASDAAGNRSVSEPVTVTVAGAAAGPLLEGRYERAVRLLERLGWGIDNDQLADVLVRGESAWLERQLAAGWDGPEERGARAAAMAALPEEGEYQFWNRVIRHAIATPNPARARLVLWVENHFSVWHQKVGGRQKWREHVAFARTGPCAFGDLLRLSANSGAMLVYLDQQRSFARSLNENYAREIMELHTLGVDAGYEQRDVTELARLLTGWGAQDEADLAMSRGEFLRYFRFDPYLNDSGAREVFGFRVPAAAPDERADRVRQVLEMLAAHPSTARHIARKMAEHYVSVPAPGPLVDRLAGEYHASGGDLRAMLRALASAPEFWDRAAPPRIMQPLEFGIALSRTSQSVNTHAVHQVAQRCGRGLFDRASPDGYPEADNNYADSNSLLQKWLLAKQLEYALARALPWPMSQPEPLRNPERRALALDYLALTLTGRVLSPASQEAAAQIVLAALEAVKDPAQRSMQITTFVAQCPEMHTR
jgi:uncharacterized protein (DUF1800 family)